MKVKIEKKEITLKVNEEDMEDSIDTHQLVLAHKKSWIEKDLYIAMLHKISIEIKIKELNYLYDSLKLIPGLENN